MAIAILRRNSLKARITLATLLILLVSVWSLSLYASQVLRKDLERQLGMQQFSIVSMVAAQINLELESRLRALELVANLASQPMQESSAAMQLFIEQRPALQLLFNGGIAVHAIDGTAIADAPVLPGRRGLNYMEVDVVAAALMEGKSTIGRPILGKVLKSPVFGLAAPIHDAQGKVIGALSGVINLGIPNFLDEVTESHYGKTGGYFLIAPQYRLIVAATDKKRIMEMYPSQGVNPDIDRFVTREEGSAVFVDDLGEEVLSSIKNIPVTGWQIAVSLPVAEAFASIRSTQEHMVFATLLITILAGGLTWWMLRRQLSPLLTTVETLATLSDTNVRMPALPITKQDEIGQLIGSFSSLLEKLGQRESLLKQILDTSSVAIFLIDMEGRITQANQRMAEMFGLSQDELLRSEYVALVHPAQREIGRQNMLALLDNSIASVNFDRLYWRSDQTEFWGNLTGRRFYDANGMERGLVGVIMDINVRKLAEEQLYISAAAFESQESMIITDANNVILRVNRAFSKDTGYTAEEAVGQTPRLLKSNRHGADFYHAMWESIIRTGGWQGEIWDRRKNGEEYQKWLIISAVKDKEGTVTHYIGAQSDITARKRAEEKINELAFFDQLTGLANRTLLLDRLKQAMTASSRSGRYSALLFVDLDNFKTLNDTLSHEVGDLLLKQVARRLTLCVREGDTVARLGGDDFVVILSSLSANEAEAASRTETVSQKILAALNEIYQLGDVLHHSTASIGATLFKGTLTPVDDLMKQADLSMYKSKQAGRNTVVFFDPAMEIAVKERAALEEHLRHALDAKQFDLHFQAQVIDDGRLIGAEALLRWQHSVRGMVSPAQFIPLAEETGLILPIGDWVLETACTQLFKWATQPEMSHLTLAVNVSAHQFRQPDFVDRVLAILKDTGANPRRLKLELTESMLVENVQEIIEKMFALKARGVSFSLDDFGTGYSSLSYLKRLPLDQLKIDQSFVRDVLNDPNDAAIAKTIVALAQSLGLNVIAEGVETEAQRDFLDSVGCHAYQGYFFSRPLPVDDFEAFAKRGDPEK